MFLVGRSGASPCAVLQPLHIAPPNHGHPHVLDVFVLFIKVGHRANLDHMTSFFFPVSAIFISHIYYPSRVLKNTASLRARPHEEKKFRTFHSVSHRSTKLYLLTFQKLKTPEIQSAHRYDCWKCRCITKRILLSNVTFLFGKPIHRNTLVQWSVHSGQAIFLVKDLNCVIGRPALICHLLDHAQQNASE